MNYIGVASVTKWSSQHNLSINANCLLTPNLCALPCEPHNLNLEPGPADESATNCDSRALHDYSLACGFDLELL